MKLKRVLQTRKKQKMASLEMMVLFREIREGFEDKLKLFCRIIPLRCCNGNTLIAEQLPINMVFTKSDRDFSIKYYYSICNHAMKVAKSPGRLPGMHSVGSAEARYVKLLMIKDPAAI
jgi:hypothetical protein